MTIIDPGTRGAPKKRSGSAFAEVTPRSRVLAVIVMGTASIYFLLPVWWLVVASTKDRSRLFSNPAFWFDGFHLPQNIATLFAAQDGIFARWLLNSLIYAVGGAVLGTLLAMMAGYGLAKYRFRGREAIFGTIVGAVLIPAPLFAVPLYLMFSQVGLTNTMWAVLLPSLTSPFGVYLARIYAESAVPDELIEAARLDGARDSRILFQIASRLMAPGLVTVFLFQFVAIWTNYVLPSLMLSDATLQPVTVGLLTWQALRGLPIEHVTVITGALVSVIPVVAMFLSLQRFWTKGLAGGSIK